MVLRAVVWLSEKGWLGHWTGMKASEESVVSMLIVELFVTDHLCRFCGSILIVQRHSCSILCRPHIEVERLCQSLACLL